MVSYGTNITSVAADRALTTAVAAIENDFGECMEVCKRENARSDDGIQTAHTGDEVKRIESVRRADIGPVNKEHAHRTLLRPFSDDRYDRRRGLSSHRTRRCRLSSPSSHTRNMNPCTTEQQAYSTSDTLTSDPNTTLGRFKMKLI